jgi:hypothetical protein
MASGCTAAVKRRKRNEGHSMNMRWILATELLAGSLVATAASPARPTAADVERELTATYFHWFPEMATYYSVDPAVAGPGSIARQEFPADMES